MKTIIKKIIDEMIAYSDREELNDESLYIVKAHNEMGGYAELMSYVSEVVGWMDFSNDEFEEDDSISCPVF